MTKAQIEAFLAMEREGTITEAAESLRISQSSLSTRLQSLEEELGCLLFLRSRGSRSLQLTPEGRRFLQLAVQYENLLERMNGLGRGKVTPVLRVSSVNSLGLIFFPHVYDRFLEMHPEIDLEIQSFDTVEAGDNIEHGETDLAFTSGEFASGLVDMIPIFSEPMVIATAIDSNYPDFVSLTDLDVRKEVYTYWGGPFYAWHASQFGEDASAHLRVSTMEQLYYFLQKDDSWAVVPLSVAETLLSDDNFRILMTSAEMPYRLIKCMVNATVEDSPYVVDFLDCIKGVIRSTDNPEYKILL